MKKLGLEYFTKSIVVAIGLILVWRGVWVALDLIDKWLFGGNHIVTAILGIIIGLVFIYFPEKNLKTLERL
jgi:hypothetical protein